MKGLINNISVAGMLRFLCNYNKTGLFKIDGKDIKGFIAIKNGEIVDISSDKKSTDKRKTAIELLSVIEGGSFYFEENTALSGQPLGISVEDIIIESARYLYLEKRNSVKISDYLLPENEFIKTVRLSPGKILSVNLTDYEWNILMLFNGDNSIKTAIEDSKVDKEKAEFVVYGLSSAGLVRRTRFKLPEIAKIAHGELGNIGAAIVNSEIAKQNIDKTRMGMRELIKLLNSLEGSFAEIIGKTKAKAMIEKIWSAAK